MNRILLLLLGTALSSQLFAQSADERTERALPRDTAEVTRWQFRWELGIGVATQQTRDGQLHPDEPYEMKGDFGMLFIHTRPSQPALSYITGLRFLGRGRHRGPNQGTPDFGPIQVLEEEIWGQYAGIPLLVRWNVSPKKRFSWTLTGGLQLHQLVQISGRSFDSDDQTPLFDFLGPWRQNPEAYQLDPGISLAAGFRGVAGPRIVFSVEAYYDGIYFNAFDTPNYPIQFWDSVFGVRLSMDLPFSDHHAFIKDLE